MNVTINTYKELRKWVSAFAANPTMGLMMIVGHPGQSKSRIVEESINWSEAFLLKAGNLSAYQLYIQLYKNRGKLLVLDDIESIYSDKPLIRLLKALCETEKEKQLNWTTSAKQLDAEGIPRSFTSTSRVCIIANRYPHEYDDHLSSLIDRGYMALFSPSNREVFNYGKTFFKDKEILRYVEKCLPYVGELSLRIFDNALKLRKEGLDWKKAVLQTLKIHALMTYIEVTEDNSFRDDIQRFNRFHEVTGLSRPMYYASRDKYEQISGKKTPPKYKRVQPRRKASNPPELIMA